MEEERTLRRIRRLGRGGVVGGTFGNTTIGAVAAFEVITGWGVCGKKD